MPSGEWKEYFVFSKKERIAVFILLGIIVVFIALSYFYTPVFSKPYVDATVQKQLNALAAKNHSYPVTVADSSSDDSDSAKTVTTSSAQTKELFYFDPNTIDAEGWKRLGFRDKTIENITNYRKANGNFKVPEDLYKVPRIRKKAVAAVLAYIRIGSAVNQPLPKSKAQAPIKSTAAGVEPGKGVVYKPININTATPEDFKVFPGMTDAVANRIIKFRTKLNGFTSVDDVAKTYGLPDSTFKIMRPYLKL